MYILFNLCSICVYLHSTTHNMLIHILFLCNYLKVKILRSFWPTESINHSCISEETSKTMSEVFVGDILKVILDGLYDEDCPLSKLRGCPHVMKFIWKDVRDYWKSKVFLPDMKKDVHRFRFFSAIKHTDFDLDPEGIEWYLKFPEPSGININMMPFLGR